jgi:RHS repeat-associated protein
VGFGVLVVGIGPVGQPGEHGGPLSYGYDALGDLTSQSGSGATAPTDARTYAYDIAGRLTAAASPAGTDSFGYNADSALTSASGLSGSSSFTYNNDGLVSTATDSAGTTAYTYDQAGRLATEADPLTGATLTWAYNADSNPTSVSYAIGGTAGPAQAFGYDSLQRVASDTLTSASGTQLQPETYGWDANGNLTSQTVGSYSGTYAYDQASRLVSATAGGGTTAYAYDNAGNLTQSGTTTSTYNAQDERTSSTTAAATTGYAYTLAGALASVTPPGGTAAPYTWDANGDLVSAPGSVGYGYDALGRMVSRSTGSGSSSLSYLGEGAALVSDGTVRYSYTPSGAVTAVGTAGAGEAVVTDHHGDLTGWFNPAAGTGPLAGSATYSPYGTPSASGNMGPVGFQGDYTDPATGLVDMGARWFQPGAGIFESPDTIGGSPVSPAVDGNGYAYAGGNPLTDTDPTGHLTNPPVTVIDGSPYVDVVVAGAWVGYELGSYLGSHLFNSPGYVFGSSFDPFASAMAGWAAENSYALASGQAVGGPFLATVPGGPVGSPGAGAWAAGPGPVAPPAPPPQPKDCFAGPDPTCTPAPPPTALLDQPYETSHVHEIISVAELFARGRGIAEKMHVRQGPVGGVNAEINPVDSESTVNDGLSLVDVPITAIGPGTPSAGLPANGGSIGEDTSPATATGGGSMGSGGGSIAPGASGACEPGDGSGEQDGRSLKDLAEQVRLGASHPAAKNQRVIAIGEDSQGGLHAGSSAGFDAGQRAVLRLLGIGRVPAIPGYHAEEEVLTAVPDLLRIGISGQPPCGPEIHDCLQQLTDAGVEIDC